MKMTHDSEIGINVIDFDGAEWVIRPLLNKKKTVENCEFYCRFEDLFAYPMILAEIRCKGRFDDSCSSGSLFHVNPNGNQIIANAKYWPQLKFVSRSHVVRNEIDDQIGPFCQLIFFSSF